MADKRPASSRRAALKVWLQLLGLLAGVFVFGLIILLLRRMI